MIELGRSEAIDLLGTLEEVAPVVLTTHLLTLLLAVEDAIAVLVGRLFPGAGRMTGWITSAEAVARVGLRRAEIYRLLDGQPDFWLRFDRRRHAVLVPEAVVARLVAQRDAAGPPPGDHS